MKSGVGIKQQLFLQDYLISESLFSAKGLLRKIIFITISLELITFVLIYFTWGDEMVFNSQAQKLFFTAFHAVSAFCNAGFSLFTNGLADHGVATSYILHIVVAISMIFGTIGFSTIQDIFNVQRLRDRYQNPWKDWNLSTKVAVYTTAFLIVFGMLVFYLLERDYILSEKNFIEATITSFFQSVTRTAGFNTVDIGALRTPTLILLAFLMFIGASSGSVGGGIKTSTFYLILVSVFSTIRGRLKIEIDKKFIPKELLFKALSIFSLQPLLT